MKHIFLEILKNKKYYDEENDETIEIYNKCTKIKVIQKDRYYFYELFVPYYSIFETPDNNVVARRKAIYLNQVQDDN